MYIYIHIYIYIYIQPFLATRFVTPFTLLVDSGPFPFSLATRRRLQREEVIIFQEIPRPQLLPPGPFFYFKRQCPAILY